MTHDVDAIAEQLRRHAPFSAMAPEHVRYLIEHGERASYAKGQVIVGPGAAEPDRFCIILDGMVEAVPLPGMYQEEHAGWDLAEGDCFPVGALLSRTAVSSTYAAAEATSCYAVPAEDFRILVALSPEFKDFCTHRLASLLDRFRRLLQAQSTRHTAEAQFVTRPLATLVRRSPVSCLPDATIGWVLETMRWEGIGAMIITDADRHPIGIFTLHDVLDRVALTQADPRGPISSVMSTGLTTLPSQATAYDAALLMVREAIRHVLVVDDGVLVGIVSEKDLFSMQRISMRQVSSAIRAATDVSRVVQLSGEIQRLARDMLGLGIAAEQLTQLIASLNDVLTQRAVTLESAAEDLDGISFAWLALGSEGRLEQTFATDQDNAIVFAAPDGMSADQVRERLLPVAQRINRTLHACGFTLCPGNIMAGNPAWCLSAAEWQNRFAAWIDSGNPTALLDAAIFFDFRHLHGDEALTASLRAWLTGHAAANPRFLHQMATNAVRVRPPLGLLRDFVLDGAREQRNTLDLKLSGARPFVDAARIYALRCRVPHTNTVQRIRAIGPQLQIPTHEIEAWIQAFLFVQLLRLRNQRSEDDRGQKMDNRINPYRLHELDRLTLKEAFRQARKFQSRLALDYRL